jgi:uncharacterized glyoxalase superfamily protein PhnB
MNDGRASRKKQGKEACKTSSSSGNPRYHQGRDRSIVPPTNRRLGDRAVDACAQAKLDGARIVRELVDENYGSREYSARDLEGNLWSFGTYDPYAND